MTHWWNTPFNQPQPNAGHGGFVPPFAWNAPPPPDQGIRSSSKYPHLHPVLAADTTMIRFDIRKKPRSEIISTMFYNVHNAPVTSYPINHMRIISKQFPWTIDIVSAMPITCEAVWDGLYAALQEHIADSEWGLAIGDKKLRETIEKSAKHRAEQSDEKTLKRIDWLGENTVFRGLERDDSFAKVRLLPGTKECNETWVVKFGCSDVVKKPKLDNHYYKCHSAVECLDCSTTFNGPSEWKGHTQCISEAQKYQKSIYKGPETRPDMTARTNNRGNHNHDAGGYSSFRGRGRGNMQHSRPWGRGGYGGYNRSSATGCNDIPLGKVRDSPMCTPRTGSPPDGGNQPTSPVKHVENGQASDSQKLMEPTGTTQAGDKKKKKDRKEEAGNENGNNGEQESKKRKREKEGSDNVPSEKKKKVKKEHEALEKPTTEASDKKSRKEKNNESTVQEEEGGKSARKEKKKEKQKDKAKAKAEDPGNRDVAENNDGHIEESIEKKAKKDKKDKKKDKKDKKDAAEDTGENATLPEEELKRRKKEEKALAKAEKKRRRESGLENGSLVSVAA